ncbi:pyrimidine dimer DNA glycosylase/endonuclease V [Litorihabitans aurantiacus]|uniref:Pyrimidine dimer DNA glycosylase /DNA-(Apurinic or apyrimidinic site) lyase n=1 Tax=Litorihabitans aurantiacus TaxID=1930061 RepID=A0AA37XE61_9MICO|nr:pyrimidine dimer DNA glycosylase/endonuclease V [Litorihabitans aurantiacus]GMA31531.1 pyrimidine dimer DNA glycosylase /DNA-(apurinic or apyrimidinic site) lyase [Litorihabitans aurantiacus]
MRIWSLHPDLLDRPALVAGWREGLLAQAVLAGRTTGFRAHPQLVRFREDPAPVRAIGAHLTALAQEATARGYRFDVSRILEPGPADGRLEVTSGQLAFELAHLRTKVEARSAAHVPVLDARVLRPHPVFREVPGPVAAWERT